MVLSPFSVHHSQFPYSFATHLHFALVCQHEAV